MIWDVWFSPILTTILLNDAVDDVQLHCPLSIRDSLGHYRNHCDDDAAAAGDDDAIDYARYMYRCDVMLTEPKTINTKIEMKIKNGHLIKAYLIFVSVIRMELVWSMWFIFWNLYPI